MWEFSFRSHSRVSGLRGKWSPYGKVQLRKWKQLLTVFLAVVRNCLTVKGKCAILNNSARKYGQFPAFKRTVFFGTLGTRLVLT